MTYVPILCLDFDGVIHSYTSGWKGADVIPDPIVPGTVEFIMAAQNEGWKIAVFSSRSNQPGGLAAMQEYMKKAFEAVLKVEGQWWVPYGEIDWPTEKPPATLTLDDRSVTFTGKWPSMEYLKNFRPWTKGKSEEQVITTDEDALIGAVLRKAHVDLKLDYPVAIGVLQDGTIAMFKGTETDDETLMAILQQLVVSVYKNMNNGVVPKSITIEVVEAGQAAQ